MEKLKLSDITGYLPYDLLVLHCNEVKPFLSKTDRLGLEAKFLSYFTHGAKPILRPLKDLIKPINGIYVLDFFIKNWYNLYEKKEVTEIKNRRICNDYGCIEMVADVCLDNKSFVRYSINPNTENIIYEIMFIEDLDILNKYLFDYRGLIKRGLAVDINTLYK